MGQDFRVVEYKVWRKTLDSILKVQEVTIEYLKERFFNAEKEHDPTLVPYAKQFYFQKLTQEYMNYLDNKMMRDISEKLKDDYIFAINHEGIPMLFVKEAYNQSIKGIKKSKPDFYR